MLLHPSGRDSRCDEDSHPVAVSEDLTRGQQEMREYNSYVNPLYVYIYIFPYFLFTPNKRSRVHRKFDLLRVSRK